MMLACAFKHYEWPGTLGFAIALLSVPVAFIFSEVWKKRYIKKHFSITKLSGGQHSTVYLDTYARKAVKRARLVLLFAFSITPSLAVTTFEDMWSPQIQLIATVLSFGTMAAIAVSVPGTNN